MDDEQLSKALGLMTEKELEEMNQRWKKKEEEGFKNVLKHFDRIHDKLFSLNNILIAGYFALTKIENNVSKMTIIIPLVNLIILMGIEFRMMQKSRFETSITDRKQTEIAKWGISITKTNQYSLLAICSTAAVLILFLYYIWR